MGIKKQKTTGLFDFRFEIQKQKLNYTAFFFHFHFHFHITKITSLVNRNEKTDQKQPFIHILAPEAWQERMSRSETVKESRLMTETSKRKMDQYVVFRKSKRVCLRDEDMTGSKLSRIFQVKTFFFK